MGLMSMFPGGGSTNNQPLKAPTNFVATAGGQTSINLNWTDPENEYAQPSGVLIGEWMFTRIIRKTGSPPVNANDGILVVESGVKNQYQTTPYVDTGLISNTVYYYAAFAFTKTRVSSPGAQTTYHLKGYDSVLNNNSWDVIALAVREGDASSVWSRYDTKDLVLTDGSIMTMNLLSFNPTEYPLSDGSGTPGLLFGTQNLCYVKTPFFSYNIVEMPGDFSPLGYFSSSYRVGSSTVSENKLRPLIEGIYNSFPSDLKPFVQTVNLKFDAVDAAYTDYGEGSGKIFPFRADTVESYYTTASRRIKRMSNGAGDISGWHLGDIYTGKITNYETYAACGGQVYTTGGVKDNGGSSIDAEAIREELGVCFGFCFEKAVTS